jgi:hypothetical protein
MNGPQDNLWIERTLLVQYFRQAEADMNLHKWYQSEKMGRDIGWEAAVVDWTLKIASHFYESHPAEGFISLAAVKQA